MRYISTRNSDLDFSAAQAITQGLSRDGGLFTPVEFPQLTEADVRELTGMDYQHRAARIMSLFLADYSEEELLSFANAGYGSDKFDTPAVAPLRKVDEACRRMNRTTLLCLYCRSS